MIHLSTEFLNECFIYDKIKGVLIWKDRPQKHFRSISAYSMFNTKFSGRNAGHCRKDGYCQVSINNTLYLRSTICWVMLHGVWPELTIDHKDRNPSNDRAKNLRQLSPTAQLHNQKIRKDNKLGFRNIKKAKTKSGTRFVVEFSQSFQTLEDAVTWRNTIYSVILKEL